MDEQRLIVDHIFLFFSQQCLQFSHVHPSQIHLREYQAVVSPDCILPPFPPPWWEWAIMFLSLQTGRGGGPGRLAERMADRVCVYLQCVCLCVEGCWQQRPCWDSPLLLPLNIQLPSHQTHCYLHGPANPQSQQLPRVYVCAGVCVWLCIGFQCRALPVAFEGLHLRVKWHMSVYTCESVAANVSRVFSSEGNMNDACVWGYLLCVCTFVYQLKWDDGMRNDGGRIGVLHVVHSCLCHFPLVFTYRCFKYFTFEFVFLKKKKKKTAQLIQELYCNFPDSPFGWAWTAQPDSLGENPPWNKKSLGKYGFFCLSWRCFHIFCPAATLVRLMQHEMRSVIQRRCGTINKQPVIIQSPASSYNPYNLCPVFSCKSNVHFYSVQEWWTRI